jgi:hypothetical protein
MIAPHPEVSEHARAILLGITMRAGDSSSQRTVTPGKAILNAC